MQSASHTPSSHLWAPSYPADQRGVGHGGDRRANPGRKAVAERSHFGDWDVPKCITSTATLRVDQPAVAVALEREENDEQGQRPACHGGTSGLAETGGGNEPPKPPKAPFVGSVSWGPRLGNLTPWVQALWREHLGAGRKWPPRSVRVFAKGPGVGTARTAKSPFCRFCQLGGCPRLGNLALWLRVLDAECHRAGRRRSQRGVLAKRGGGGTSRQNRQKPFCRFCQLGGTPLRASFCLSRSTQLMVRTSAMG
jgi:hypothetical protein